MGRVVAFERPERASRSSHPREGERMGQILFFTGVRYERFAEPPQPRSGPTSGTPRRRRGA